MTLSSLIVARFAFHEQQAAGPGCWEAAVQRPAWPCPAAMPEHGPSLYRAQPDQCWHYIGPDGESCLQDGLPTLTTAGAKFTVNALVLDSLSASSSPYSTNKNTVLCLFDSTHTALHAGRQRSGGRPVPVANTMNDVYGAVGTERQGDVEESWRRGAADGRGMAR